MSNEEPDDRPPMRLAGNVVDGVADRFPHGTKLAGMWIWAEQEQKQDD